MTVKKNAPNFEPNFVKVQFQAIGYYYIFFSSVEDPSYYEISVSHVGI